MFHDLIHARCIIGDAQAVCYTRDLPTTMKEVGPGLCDRRPLILLSVSKHSLNVLAVSSFLTLTGEWHHLYRTVETPSVDATKKASKVCTFYSHMLALIIWHECNNHTATHRPMTYRRLIVSPLVICISITKQISLFGI